MKGRDCLVRYRRDGNVLAVASIYRDLENLKEEWAMERRMTYLARDRHRPHAGGREAD
jgi:hypothetical protein